MTEGERTADRLPLAGAGLPLPEELAELLTLPLVAYMATHRPDGGLQCNPMWFLFEDGTLQFSHTSDRQKMRNLTDDPQVSVCIPDAGNPYRYLEVRGVVVAIRTDSDAKFHRRLRRWYGMDPTHVDDADRRVVVVVRPTRFTGRAMADPTQRGV